MMSCCRETDTDFSSVWANVNGVPVFGSPLNAFYGDLGNGGYNVPESALFVDFVLTNPDDVAEFGFNIVNHGGTDLSGFETALNQLVTVAAEVAVTVETDDDDPDLGADSDTFKQLVGSIESLLDDLINVIFPDCDGLVAAESFKRTKAEIDAMLRPAPSTILYVNDKLYPGTDSPWGCGSNSRYRVWYVLAQLHDP